MPKLFISYRRADSQVITGRIYDRLSNVFGEKNVFKDVDDIPIGADFRAVLHQAVAAADIILVMIGDQWADITYSNGKRRLDDPDDFVRIEVENALREPDALVVPVLLQGASMPAPDDLPETLRPLCYRNAIMVRNDPDFGNDMRRLIESVRQFDAKNRQANAPRLPWTWIAAAMILLLVGGGALAFALGNTGNNPPDETALTDVPTEIAQQDGSTNPIDVDANEDNENEDEDTPNPTPTNIPPTETRTAVPTPAFEYPAIIVQEDVELNVRTGPGLNFDKIAEINAGDRYDITARTLDSVWLRINYEGERGWICAGQLNSRTDCREFVEIVGNVSQASIDNGPPTPTPRPTSTPTTPPPPTHTLIPTETPYSILRREDCLGYDASQYRIVESGGTYYLASGRSRIVSFPNQSEAEQAFTIIRAYELTTQCFVGRPDPPLTYWLADGEAPRGSLRGEDCIAFNPDTAAVTSLNGRWVIRDGNSLLFNFDSSRDDAEQALSILRHYEMRHTCYVGRPDPSFSYLRR